MMAALSIVTSGLQAALLLMRGRPDGIRQVRAGRDGLTHSFWAMAICLPAVLCLRLIGWAEDGLPPHAGHRAALDLLFFVIGWLAYVEISRPVVGLLGRAERWPLFVAAWNWCNVAQYVLLVAAAIPGLLGAPDWLDETCSLVALGWALWLEWYVARLALDIEVIPAIGLVLMDVGIGVLLATLADSLT